jgi:predicted ABC-type ATPase
MSAESAGDAPQMVILAGPNGSGKSTVTQGLREQADFPKLYINADDIARAELAHVAHRADRELKAAQMAEARRREALANGQSFAFETVLSTPAKLALIDEAKAQGFTVHLIYVTTQDASINVGRVANRIEQGGHAVSPEKIRERYHRAMHLLPAAALKADTVDVFDNSSEERMKAPLPVVTKEDGQWIVAAEAPQWARERIVQPIMERIEGLTALTQEQIQETPPAKVSAANIGGSAVYRGTVSRQDKNLVMQRVGLSNAYVIHDKAALPPGQVYTDNRLATISYAFGADGKHAGPRLTRIR